MIDRFSSRREALGPVLSARLTGATTYLRIPASFRSSLLEVVGETLEGGQWVPASTGSWWMIEIQTCRC